MKTLGSFINKKTLRKSAVIDQQSVFYVFQIVIKEEYGRQGLENVLPMSLKDRKVFISAGSSFWENEILLKRKQIVAKINKELGGDEIIDIVITV
ncbi:MAG TPA: hypothetical protein DEA43_03855 [Candidatus Moranbacteria bacterium]|nr:DciA family protein [Candidatus Moranbacteria bacterium]HBI33971.1 hypothetical protein [Candidatus Moranbacteria bacterium]HBT45988.1 hypothetical protein [Candidatus Moranbacteria bacterium]